MKCKRESSGKKFATNPSRTVSEGMVRLGNVDYPGRSLAQNQARGRANRIGYPLECRGKTSGSELSIFIRFAVQERTKFSEG